MREVYFDFGGTLIVGSVPILEMVVNTLKQDGNLEAVGGEERVNRLYNKYVDRFGMPGFNEHARHIYFSDLASFCPNPGEVVESLKKEEVKTLKTTQDNLQGVLSKLSKDYALGVVTEASVTEPVLGFLDLAGLKEMLPVVYGSSGRWELQNGVYVQTDSWESRAFSEDGFTKADGSLYRLMLEKGMAKLPALMVGDNPVYDGVIPRNEGFDVLAYCSGRPQKRDEIIKLAEEHNIKIIERLEEVERYLK